jgi:hypothetical protein
LSYQTFPNLASQVGPNGNPTASDFITIQSHGPLANTRINTNHGKRVVRSLKALATQLHGQVIVAGEDNLFAGMLITFYDPVSAIVFHHLISSIPSPVV